MEEMVSVKFLEGIKLTIPGPDGKPARRTYREGQITELPLELAKKLFAQKKILPGIQHGPSMSFKVGAI